LRWGHNARKAGVLTLVIAVVVLSTVFAVSMLPGVDLQPTALRASRAAQGMFLAFALLVSIASGFFQITSTEPETPLLAGNSYWPPHEPLFDLLCVRLC
jgi:hypothetical protein